ncbi:homoprotocatechuate catabolism bifunctionalisomerase/decarboxylase [Striga asiatica]|uniref:Homoprotocatechuate catabolism bifunctionalisomerase/decarboxylase n=1 Tax=Striga asiatica TaxID=4170 RepID=A0A5A7PES4_STRAF|nr:homoprotocatechuate catabolism bifunctionalisomerase/decarboxylase [Striga asiatica]
MGKAAVGVEKGARRSTGRGGGAHTSIIRSVSKAVERDFRRRNSHRDRRRKLAGIRVRNFCEDLNFTDINALGISPRTEKGSQMIIRSFNSPTKEGHFSQLNVYNHNFDYEPAALLAKPLGESGSDDGGGLGVELTHLVAAVVVLGVAQVRVAALGLAPGRVARTGVEDPGPAVEPVHEVVLRRGEVGPAAEVQPDPAAVLHGVELQPAPDHRRLGFRDHQESVRPGRLEGQHRRRLVVGVGGGGRAVGGAWVVEWGGELGVWVLRWGEREVAAADATSGGDEVGFRVDDGGGGFREVLGGVRVEDVAGRLGIVGAIVAGEHDRRRFILCLIANQAGMARYDISAYDEMNYYC